MDDPRDLRDRWMKRAGGKLPSKIIIDKTKRVFAKVPKANGVLREGGTRMFKL